MKKIILAILVFWSSAFVNQNKVVEENGLSLESIMEFLMLVMQPFSLKMKTLTEKKYFM